MSKKIALLLSGNLRTFFYNDNYIAKKYLELANNHDIDIYIYTDNNDFYYNDCQYYSEHNKNKTLGILNDYNKRIYKNTKFINYENAYKIITKNLIEIFGNKLKKLCIDNFTLDQLDLIYDKNNNYHNKFMNNPYSQLSRKTALMCQQWKVYKCYNLMVDYEKENNFKYDIIIKSRFDTLLRDINKIDIKNLDYEKKLYCFKHRYWIADVWAIGDRFIMDKYCNYYNVISCNIYNNVYSLDGNNTKNSDSDACEFGLTYLIKNIHGYNFCHTPLNEICFKFYDNNLFNYFKDLNS